MNNTPFQVGHEMQNTVGQTIRLCLTAKGKTQWRVVGEDGEVIKRGRASGTSLMSEVTLTQILQQVGGRKLTSAVKALAKELGNEDVMSSKIPVSTKWSGEESAPAAKPAKAETPKAEKSPKVVAEVI